MLGDAGTDSGPLSPSASSRFDAVSCTLEKSAQQTVMSSTAVCTGLCLFLINLTCSTVFSSIYGTIIISRPLRCLIYILGRVGTAHTSLFQAF